MNIIGYCKLKGELPNTISPMVDLDTLAWRALPVIERNDRGDCLCVVDNQALVDVDGRDVAIYMPREIVDPSYKAEKDLFALLAELGGVARQAKRGEAGEGE